MSTENTQTTEVTKSEATKSQLIFDTLRANRKRGAKIEQLVEATELKTSYMGSYMAEFKRVYGANVEYNKTTKRYKLKNIKEVGAKLKEKLN